MKTDHLIDLLSTNLEPVPPARFGRALIVALVGGGAAALLLMLSTIGPRPDLNSPVHLRWTVIKELFALSVIAAGAPLLLKSMRPGLETKARWSQVLLPFMVAFATAVLLLFYSGLRVYEVMLGGATGRSSVRCLLCIIVFAAIPFAALLWTLRKGAPTRLRLSGFIAGIVAGGVGAAAYAFGCLSDTIPFIAVWYTAAIGTCGLFGAELGSWLLRW
jgi:hypothetical protein